VDFQTISATDSCGEVGTGLTGSTVGFDPTEVSTANSYFFASTLTQQFPNLLEAMQPTFTQFDTATRQVNLTRVSVQRADTG
jgi:hypothetical protein